MLRPVILSSALFSIVLFAQGRDLSGQRPDETNAVCWRAGNEIVIPNLRHSVDGSVLPIHALKVPFLPSEWEPVLQIPGKEISELMETKFSDYL